MSKDITQRIIDKIKINKISTTEIADCLNKSGVIPNVSPINKGQYKVGKVFLAYAYNEKNWNLHKQLEFVNKDEIVIVETHNCNNRAVFGELVSKYLMLYKQVSAIVVNGYLRDAQNLIKEKYPIWGLGVTPLGCYNKINNNKLSIDIINAWTSTYEGSIAVCDDSGVVIIQPKYQTEKFLEKLDFIELQEDIWFHCIDTKKMSTYETVCLQKYLKNEAMPPEYIKKLKELNF